MTDRYELICFEKYKVKEEVRCKAHRVGSAIPGKDGSFTLFIPQGISITGRVVLVPPERAKMPELDLVATYHAAADDYGL